MSVSHSSSPVSAGVLPTTAGTSTMDTPAVAGNDLAVDMQGMTVESGTPTKQAPEPMSMWEGIRAVSVLDGPG